MVDFRLTVKVPKFTVEGKIEILPGGEASAKENFGPTKAKSFIRRNKQRNGPNTFQQGNLAERLWRQFQVHLKYKYTGSKERGFESHSCHFDHNIYFF